MFFNKISLHLILIQLLAVVCLATACSKSHDKITVQITSQAAQVTHGIKKLKSLEADGIWHENNSKIHIVGKIDSSQFAPEAFNIKANPQGVEIMAGDATGMMYALLDIKEQLEIYGKVTSKQEAPNLYFRAIKSNFSFFQNFAHCFSRFGRSILPAGVERISLAE